MLTCVGLQGYLYLATVTYKELTCADVCRTTRIFILPLLDNVETCGGVREATNDNMSHARCVLDK